MIDIPNKPGHILAECDVAIVGGGVAGCSLSYFLGREGIETVLIEKGALCSEASGANAGSIHEQIFTSSSIENRATVDRIAKLIPIFLQGAKEWENLALELNAKFDISRSGGLLVMEQGADLDRLRYKVAQENKYGGSTKIISKQELREIAPYLLTEATGAVYSKHEGKIDILKALPMLWQAIKNVGVQLKTYTELTSVERSNEQVKLHTKSGVIKCKRVVFAGGGWNSKLTEMVGWKLPLRSSPIQALATEKAPIIVKHMLQHATRRMTLKQNHHGSVVIGGGWPGLVRDKSLPPYVLPSSMSGAISNAIHVVPELAGIQVLRAWSSYISTPADDIPAVGGVPGTDNCFVLATNIYGVTVGPYLAKLLTQYLLTGESNDILEHLSPSRTTLNK